MAKKSMIEPRKITKRKRILRHLGKVAIAFLSAGIMVSPSGAIDPVDAASQAIGAEGGREAAKSVLNSALKVAKSKPALSTATGIVCLACIPVAGAAASPGLCIACGILIAKTFG